MQNQQFFVYIKNIFYLVVSFPFFHIQLEPNCAADLPRHCITLRTWRTCSKRLSKDKNNSLLVAHTMKWSLSIDTFFIINQCKERAGCLRLCMNSMMSSPLPMVQNESFVLLRPSLVMQLTCDIHKTLTKISTLRDVIYSTNHTVQIF